LKSVISALRTFILAMAQSLSETTPNISAFAQANAPAFSKQKRTLESSLGQRPQGLRVAKK
jgi:ABC-type Zn uptake system ZnuABC Zn-binding protein ZnuA